MATRVDDVGFDQPRRQICLSKESAEANLAEPLRQKWVAGSASRPSGSGNSATATLSRHSQRRVKVVQVLDSTLDGEGQGGDVTQAGA